MIQNFFAIVQHAIDLEIGSNLGDFAECADRDAARSRPREATACPETSSSQAWICQKAQYKYQLYRRETVSMLPKSVAIELAVVVVCEIVCQVEVRGF